MLHLTDCSFVFQKLWTLSFYDPFQMLHLLYCTVVDMWSVTVSLVKNGLISWLFMQNLSQSIICHMGSHSVTCHPTRRRWTCPASTRFTYPGGMEGWVGIVVGFI